VVIACYNAAATIADQLEALAQQSWGHAWEVIVVNNCSTDDSVAVVNRYRNRIANLRLVDASEKQGQAYALNVGVRVARAPYVAFCDADDVVGKGWVSAMGAALEHQELVSGPHDISRLNSPEVQRSRGNAQPTGIQQYTNPPYLPHAGSGNMGVQRALFESLHGFDESMPALFDTDFCWRAQLAGAKLTAVEQAVLHIRYRDSLRASFRQGKVFGYWNVFMYKRYRKYGMPTLSWKRGVRAWLDLVRSATRLLRRDKRMEWVWNLGWQVGRLSASIRYRVLAL
jgi:glycosyltransferase involved in cell wall biosynthesis